MFIGSAVLGTIAGKTSLKYSVKRIDLNAKNATTTCGAKEPVPCEASSPKDTSCGTVQNVCGGTPPPATEACGQTNKSNQKFTEAFTFAWALFKRIFPYVLLGAVISAVSAVFVPDAWVEKYLGNDSPLAIPIAATVGIPLYLRIEMAIPILQTLILKGMSMGAAMALIIGGTGASLPEIAIISSMLKTKAIVAFVLSVMTMAIVGGFIFYFLF